MDTLKPAVDALRAQLQEEEQKVIETKRLINALLVRMGEPAQFTNFDSASAVSTDPGRRDLYYGQAFATAARMFLEWKRQACSAEEIMSGMEKGGFDFDALGWKSKDRLRIVAVSLAKNSGTFEKLPNNTFGLVSWYPDVVKKVATRERRPKNGVTNGEAADDESPESVRPENGENTAENAPQ